MKPLDMDTLRATIEALPEGSVAVVTSRWLEQVERELLAARAMMAGQGRMNDVVALLAAPVLL